MSMPWEAKTLGDQYWHFQFLQSSSSEYAAGSDYSASRLVVPGAFEQPIFFKVIEKCFANVDLRKQSLTFMKEITQYPITKFQSWELQKVQILKGYNHTYR